MMSRNIYSGFLKSSERCPSRLALEVEGRSLTYAELREQAERIAATLRSLDNGIEPLLTAVFAYRSVVAFSGKPRRLAAQQRVAALEGCLIA